MCLFAFFDGVGEKIDKIYSQIHIVSRRRQAAITVVAVQL